MQAHKLSQTYFSLYLELLLNRLAVTSATLQFKNNAVSLLPCLLHAIKCMLLQGAHFEISQLETLESQPETPFFSCSCH